MSCSNVSSSANLCNVAVENCKAKNRSPAKKKIASAPPEWSPTYRQRTPPNSQHIANTPGRIVASTIYSILPVHRQRIASAAVFAPLFQCFDVLSMCGTEIASSMHPTNNPQLLPSPIFPRTTYGTAGHHGHSTVVSFVTWLLGNWNLVLS